MIKTTTFIAFAGLALAIATTAASAQGLTAHSPPSDKKTQGSVSYPSMRKSAGDPVAPNSDSKRQHHKAGWDLKSAKRL